MKKIISIVGTTALLFLPFVLLKGGNDGSKKEEVKVGLPVQEISVRVDGTKPPGYFLSHTTIKKGSKVRLNFTTNGEQGCIRAITIPSKNIRQVLPESGLVSVEFTADKEGEIPIICDMGMYFVSLNVVA